MKHTVMKHVSKLLAVLATALVLGACSTSPVPQLEAQSQPENPGGNCDLSVIHDGASYLGMKADLEQFVDGKFLFTDIPGTDGMMYDVLATLGADNKSVSFTVYLAGTDTVVDAEVGFCYKGGPGNSGLGVGLSYDAAADEFLNPGGQTPALSNLVVYFVVPGEPPVEACWADETAWAAGSRYTARGNWATYTAYGGVAKTVTLFAGQTHVAGTVKLEPVSGGVKITITLNEGFRFADTAENVKIRGYSKAPSGNPEPGLFTTHKGKAGPGMSYSVTVPMFAFYGIHADLERQVACPAH